MKTYRTYVMMAVWSGFLLIMGGCMNLAAYYDIDTDIIESSHRAADMLIERMPLSLRADQPILVSSLVNIDDLETSSTFGRTISEYIGSRFVQRGFQVVEMKVRKSVLIQKKEGEFLLSREAKDLIISHHAHALLVGTYSVADDVVYVSARMVSPVDNLILASYEYKLALGNNNSKMLGIKDLKRDSRFPGGPLDAKYNR